MYGRLRIENLLDPFRRHACTGEHNGNHCDHEECHDNLHGVGNECHHIAYLQVSGINPFSAEPDNHDGDAVHDHHHHGHHERHNPVCKQLCFHQILIGCFKTVFLKLFPAEGTYYGNTCKDFPGYQIQTVNQRLHFLEFGHGDTHQHKNHCGNSHYRHSDNPSQAGSGTHNLDNASDTNDRGIQYHTKQHNLYHLHLLDIVGASCNQGSYGELIQFVIGKGYHLGKYLSPQIHTDFSSCP